MLIFVVARTRLDRYEQLRRQFGDWRDVRIILDRREGERRHHKPPMPKPSGGVMTDAARTSQLSPS